MSSDDGSSFSDGSAGSDGSDDFDTKPCGETLTNVEERWYDVLVRRPNDAGMHRRAREQCHLEPTQVYTSSHGDITLALEGFPSDSEQTMISSGLSCWDASEHLCNYLLADDELKQKGNYRLLELGSGLGKCGLLLHRLIQSERIGESSIASTVLTDGDANALQLLRKNVARNTRADDNIISCQCLKWGTKGAKAFLSRQRYKNSKFDTIVGSDLLYTNRSNIDPLFDTVVELLDDRSKSGGKFVLAHNEEHLISATDVIRAAGWRDLFCEVLKQEGSIYLLCFRRPNAFSVNSVIKMLQAQNRNIGDENRALKASKASIEDRCLKLDERCTQLSGNKHLPRSVLVSFDDAYLAVVASFLLPQDFSHLACACKHFGAKTHEIDDQPASLMHKIALKLYKSSSHLEKEAMRSCNGGESPFVFYEELLELRKPLTFDRFFGPAGAIVHATGDKSRIVKQKMISGGRIKMPFGRYFFAYTAASDYVMRAGKHYATFACPEVGSLSRDNEGYLWFGVVRPLQKLDYRSPIFTPFCEHPKWKLRELYPDGRGDIHSCAYAAESGQCQWANWGLSCNEDGIGEDDDGDAQTDGSFHITDWDGMQSFNGGTIGLLLDCSEGTLAVFKNGVKLGVMKKGLSGDYCWMVVVGRWFRRSCEAGIKIERGIPPSAVEKKRKLT